MTVLRAFSLEDNVPDAARQEFDLAYQHVREVRQHLNYDNPDHVERYLDAQDRLNRARELLRE